jgi:hypothetical protein
MKGKPYSFQELQSVFSIYEQVRNSIHKSNATIIQLATTLGRDIRSVENQLLMFRAYEKEKQGNIYGRKNYNKLIPVIYDRNSGNMVQKFPERFKTFRKSEKSSVSRITDLLRSSSPIELIETPLHDFLKKIILSEKFLTSRNIIALVGGAGNGKTESLGYILNQIKETYNLFQDDDKINVQIENSISENNGYFTSFTDNNFRLSFIQDATSVWSENEVFFTKSESVSKAIRSSFEKGDNGLLVICINRGVLSDLLRELSDPELKSIFSLVDEQSNFESYVHSISNINAAHGNGFVVSSYPLDKMRLFEGEGVHSSFVMQMTKAEWSNDLYKSIFFNSQNSVGSLLDCLELIKGGLLTFRDYLNYLSLLYSSDFEEDWMNVPAVKLWFGNQMEPFIDVFSKMLKKSPNPSFGRDIEKLIKWRHRHNELMDFALLDPLKVAELISSDDVQCLLDAIRDADDNRVTKITMMSKEYELLEVYTTAFAIIGELDDWIDKVTTDYSADRYKVKRQLFNLLAQLMSFVKFEVDGVFYGSKEKAFFTSVSTDQFTCELADALGLKKLTNSTLNRFNKISLSLVDELWVNKDKLSVYKTFQLDISLQEIRNYTDFKPRLPHRLFEFKDLTSNDSFVIKISFDQYCKLLEYKGDLDIYYESFSVSFSIWINTIREKLRLFAKMEDPIIDIAGDSININSPL